MLFLIDGVKFIGNDIENIGIVVYMFVVCFYFCFMKLFVVMILFGVVVSFDMGDDFQNGFDMVFDLFILVGISLGDELVYGEYFEEELSCSEKVCV